MSEQFEKIIIDYLLPTNPEMTLAETVTINGDNKTITDILDEYGVIDGLDTIKIKISCKKSKVVIERLDENE